MNLDAVPLRQFQFLKLALAVAADLNIWTVIQPYCVCKDTSEA